MKFTARDYVKANKPVLIILGVIIFGVTCWSFISAIFDKLATERGLLFLILVTLWFGYRSRRIGKEIIP